ncbi:hypothetical protein D9758_009335 [Tetrapyrgos nigripes]|uniref:Glyoxal oxidase n=1 Tax=Tetrapyrgos nigripes TaxID=182062 RepID=A0A8H5GGU8_9AGAR|nr:hypothetical protein D9758_009335 [Tetrapyrgos nigripes]
MRLPSLIASLLPLLPTALSVSDAGLGWNFVQNGTTGITALEAIVVSPTLIVIFDRVLGDPLQINGHQAWGALWNTETNSVTPLDLVTDTFCASGGFLSNGTMMRSDVLDASSDLRAELKADYLVFELPAGESTPPDQDGLMGLRIFEPCDDPAGVNCTIFENPATHHLAVKRWYTSTVRTFDGSLMIIGGIMVNTPFFSTQNLSASTFEFFPQKDRGVPRPSAFLDRSLPANLFPRGFGLPDGKVFIAANNQTIIYDIETNTETILPDIPNGVRVTNPYDGTAALLPLSPPLYIPEVLVCGGTNASDQLTNDDVNGTPSSLLSAQDPASDQCSRITLTREGIKKGWTVERMPEGRMMPEMVLMPNGEVLIINGGKTGYAALNGVRDAVGNSNADNPVKTPLLYNPSAPIGKRFSREGLPTTDIARMYHSSVSLTPAGNIFIAGSNPNGGVVTDVKFSTEFRVEYLNPPYMSVARPSLNKVPKKIAFNQKVSIPVSIPRNLNTSPGSIQVALMDLGFSSHAFHSSARLVFLEALLLPDKKTLEITSPPNNRVFPPGPAYLFLTIDGVTSTGTKIMLGSGASPPVQDQGIRLPPLF